MESQEEKVRLTVADLYEEHLQKKREAKAAKKAEKEQEKAERKAQREEDETKPDGTRMTKKERRQAAVKNWQEVIIGLTGDDLEYSFEKKKGKKKKKYRQWIGEDDDTVITKKPKKPKKKNYNKEFEPELNMLRAIVADQNRFTTELQRRFQNAAGPATKDASPLTKTLVDLAAAINTSRSNSLGYINAISGVKKAIADLYMKQKKLEAELGGGNAGSTDLGLTGSNIAASIFGDTPMMDVPPASQPVTYTPSPLATPTPVSNDTTPPVVKVEPFDPSTWMGPVSQQVSASINYETIPHSVVVEKSSSDGTMRFKAVRDDTGEELPGCPVPTSDPSRLKVNETDMTVRGEFDESYKLVVV